MKETASKPSMDTQDRSLADELSFLVKQRKELKIQLKQTKAKISLLQDTATTQLPAHEQNDRSPNACSNKCSRKLALQKSVSTDTEPSYYHRRHSCCELVKSMNMISCIVDDEPSSHLTNGALESSSSSTTRAEVHQIPDFVTVSTSDGRTAIKAKERMRAEDVTVAQWLSANARILLATMDRMTQDEVRGYLRYTVKIGDLLQVARKSSVMRLDAEHRRAIGDGRRSQRWEDITDEECNEHLDLNSPQEKKPTPIYDEQGRELCLEFNLEAGCRNGTCEKVHACSFVSCGESHPKYRHNVLRQEANGASSGSGSSGSSDFVVSCTVCYKTFYSTSNLAWHMKQHAGKNPFPCPFCDLCFPHKLHLDEHKKKHYGFSDKDNAVVNKYLKNI